MTFCVQLDVVAVDVCVIRELRVCWGCFFKVSPLLKSFVSVFDFLRVSPLLGLLENFLGQKFDCNQIPRFVAT